VGPVRLGTVCCYLNIANSSFLASNLTLPSCISDDLVNISLPLDNVFPVQMQLIVSEGTSRLDTTPSPRLYLRSSVAQHPISHARTYRSIHYSITLVSCKDGRTDFLSPFEEQQLEHPLKPKRSISSPFAI